MSTHIEWSTQPVAAALVVEMLDRLLVDCPDARRLGERLLSDTGTRLFDWLDYLALHDEPETHRRIVDAGFVARGEPSEIGGHVFDHPGGLFPTLVIDDGGPVIAVKVESVIDFIAVQGHGNIAITGDPYAMVREATVSDPETCAVPLTVIERHGSRSCYPGSDELVVPDELADTILRHAGAMRTRRREPFDGSDAFDEAGRIIGAAIADLGVDRTADLFFAAEREYWQSRNHAARVQRERQDALGMGWANHDHHTYRSSRANFTRLIAMQEKLGFVCRERFYAGAEAGWGAQVMEQPNAGVVTFNDVDLSPEEVAGDFAHDPLPERDTLGTVGLWCALHGDSFAQAGMHHLECQFDFAAAREQLAGEGVGSMKPFTDFDFLKQSFTEGERWMVAPERIEAALDRGCITPEQAERFRREGAIGSHLEVLQRDDGYKGFNQTGINEIIRKTDPRTIEA